MQVKAVIEEQRLRLGYGTHQVLFNTDLYGKTSGTYTASVSDQPARGHKDLPMRLPLRLLIRRTLRRKLGERERC